MSPTQEFHVMCNEWGVVKAQVTFLEFGRPYEYEYVWLSPNEYTFNRVGELPVHHYVNVE